MSVQQYNQYIMQVIGFTPQDLEANRRGYMTDPQKARFAAFLSQSQRSGMIAAAIVFVITVVVIGGTLITNAEMRQSFQDLYEKTPYILLVPIGAIIFWFGMIIFSMVKSNRMKSGNVPLGAVTGKVKLTEISGYGMIGAIMKTASGTNKSYEIKVGRQKILADEITIRAFQPGGAYRIYFIKLNPMGILVSAEVAQG